MTGTLVGSLGPGSGWAVAGVFMLFMALGRLIPRGWADQRIGDLKEAHALSEKAREIQAAQQEETLRLVRAINATLAAAAGQPREPV